ETSKRLKMTETPKEVSDFFVRLVKSSIDNLDTTKRYLYKQNANHKADKASYDYINEIPYLDQVIYETLRKHPPAPVLFRTATSDYQLPNTNMLIPMGTQIIIP
ncbi:putative cytochrome P450 6a13, partial [Pseudolycoriella hygida]